MYNVFIYNRLFEEAPTVYFPMIWFEQRASITPELASQIRLALAAPTWNFYVGCSHLLIGAVLIAWAAYYILITIPR